MAENSSRSRKPRIRKAAPTVREKIESGAKEAKSKPKKRRALGKPLGALWRSLKTILRPLAPLGRILLKALHWLTPSYFINAWRELKLVTWPKRRETWRLTAAVFVFALVFGALVWVVDYGLDKIFRELVLK